MRNGWELRHTPRQIGVAVLLICGLILAGCGSDNSGTPQPTRSSTPESKAPAAISISDVTWTTGIDADTHAPQDSVTQYPNNAPVIIAAVQIEPIPAGTTVTAKWAIDGVEVPETTMTATSDDDLQTGWATFRFTREGDRLFPLGDLTVEIAADDGPAVSGAVEIVLPPA